MSDSALNLGPLDELVEGPQKAKGPPPIQFYKPTELKDYQPPEGAILVGENHIVRGAVFVIGGAPGVGKSRASVALAVAGATGMEWFGLRVHRRFKTLIIQNENGRLRLKDEFGDLPCADLDDWIRVSAPPAFGLDFRGSEFVSYLREVCAAFQPDVVLIDPWNAVTRDDKVSDYLEAFNSIRFVWPPGDECPAIGIVAHTRKPKHDERTAGRALGNLLAGSYALLSVPRSAFVLQAGSDDPEDPRVVFTCCKNNDGPQGAQTAWERRNGLFVPVSDFNWTEFHGGGGKSDRVQLTEEHLKAVFHGAKIPIPRKRARELLQEQTGCCSAAAYSALSKTGRFKNHLQEDELGLLQWIP